MTFRLRNPRYLLVPVAFALGTAAGYLIAYVTGTHASLIPLASAILGLIVAFSVPLWQALFVNAPKLSVEISSIIRTISAAAVLSIDDDPELRAVRSRSPGDSDQYVTYSRSRIVTIGAGRTMRGPGGYSPTLADLDERLASRRQRLRELPAQIEEQKRAVERLRTLTAETFSKYDADQFNRPLSREIEFEPLKVGQVLEDFRRAYRDRVEEDEKLYAELQTTIPTAERRVDVLRKELIDNRSFFTVSASLINSGRSNTAIKVPALLRVSIGEGNYIDIKLTLKDFENKSEISANGTRIITFESSEVSSLPEEDRKLINTYWGQSVRSRLLIEDIHSQIYSSNPIAFAEGLYQKIIYDRLARAASLRE
jgi:hypothetical protein